MTDAAKAALIGASICGSHSAADVRGILAAGASLLRINSAYYDMATLDDLVKMCRREAASLHVDVMILIDAPSIKVRLGAMCESGVEVERDTRLILAGGGAAHGAEVPVETDSLGRRVIEGCVLVIGDGILGLRVDKVLDDNRIVVSATHPGRIMRHKSITLPGSVVDSMDHTPPHLLECIQDILTLAPDIVGISFVQDGAMIRRVRNVVSKRGLSPSRVKLAAKIESPSGVLNAREIATEADVIVVARGDMALTCPFERLGLLQKAVIKEAKSLARPVYVATQVLESAEEKCVPSRAEILDATNALLDGAGIILTNETINSAQPARVVDVLRRIVEAVIDDCPIRGSSAEYGFGPRCPL